jgi:peptide-N4-(N-acetyl-beta-glucosaminyl)asparagine amidase
LNEIINPKYIAKTPKTSEPSKKDCSTTISHKIDNLNTIKGYNIKFANKLSNSYEHVLIYEQQSLKRKALEFIPIDRLKKDAKTKHDSYKAATLEKSPYDFNDFMIIELLFWFKNEFFKWVNQPDCDICHSNQNMSFLFNDIPNINEEKWMANNVEVYE